MNSHLMMIAWPFVKYPCHTVCLTISRFFDTQNFILVRHIPYVTYRMCRLNSENNSQTFWDSQLKLFLLNSENGGRGRGRVVPSCPRNLENYLKENFKNV